MPELDESTALARFANLLGHASGRPADHALAVSALQWALSPEIVLHQGPYLGGILLAEEEVRKEPLHVTVVGGKDDPVSREMMAAALRVPSAYKLVEWWDRREGPPPRGESIFPDGVRPAAYLCANGSYSSPITDARALAGRLERATAAEGSE